MACLWHLLLVGWFLSSLIESKLGRYPALVASQWLPPLRSGYSQQRAVQRGSAPARMRRCTACSPAVPCRGHASGPHLEATTQATQSTAGSRPDLDTRTHAAAGTGDGIRCPARPAVVDAAAIYRRCSRICLVISGLD